MDKRIKEHARIIVDWSTEMGEDDNVLVLAHPEAHELVVALYEEIGKKKANPLTVYSSDEISRKYMLEHGEGFETPQHMLKMFEESDVIISIKSTDNLSTLSDVPGNILSDMSRAKKPILHMLHKKRTCLTLFPTRSHAQMAEMSLEAYQDFVWGAILRDWQEVHDQQEILRKELERTDEVRIVGPETDLRMSIKGMNPINSDGKNNLPSGEVYVAPIPDSVEGEILFDLPLMHRGREITGVKLRFDNGEVVEHSAEKNQDLLTSILETDEGAKRLGELGIGTNRDIDRFTKNMLFDEKMGDTVHLALGYAIKRSIGDDLEGNESAVHVDMIKDMQDGKIELDGEILMKNGKFRWEK